jgi:hypothetical protein
MHYQVLPGQCWYVYLHLRVLTHTTTACLLNKDMLCNENYEYFHLRVSKGHLKKINTRHGKLIVIHELTGKPCAMESITRADFNQYYM